MGSILQGITRLSDDDISAGHRTGKNLGAMLKNLRERETELHNGVRELIANLAPCSDARKRLMDYLVPPEPIAASAPLPAPPPTPPFAPTVPPLKGSRK